MTIEDVDFLIENSELNSLTIVVDSKERDFSAYPSPSSYVIPFEEPIKNVVGFEILDASIPVTEFSIDMHNRVLSLGYIFHTLGVSTEHVCEYITNYLQHSETFGNLYENQSSANFFIYIDEDIFNGVDTSLDASHNMLVYYKIIPITNTYATYSFNGYYSHDDNLELLVNSHTEHYINTETMTLVLYSFKYVTDEQALQMAAEINTQNSDPTIEIGFNALVCHVYNELPIRNFSSIKLFTLFNATVLYNSIIHAVTGGDSIQVDWEDPVTDGDVSITQRFIWNFQSTKSYAFYLDMDKTTCAENLGFSHMNVYRNTSILRYRNYQRLFLSTLGQEISEVTNMSVNIQQIYTPGIIALEGVRYVELHCPEIETHVLGNYSNFKYSPGIGLFKLIDTNTVSHLRFDFLNIIRKPFHPIGKLSRLTIQFTNRDGTFYNFKGVDHTVLISIKYYAPKQIKRKASSILNRLYNPNVLDYSFQKNKVKPPDMYIDDVLEEQKRYTHKNM
jgi:hypothetical protein